MQRLYINFVLTGLLSCAQPQFLFAQTSASYPKVDPATQMTRDADRRHILETELQAERQELAKAEAAPVAIASTERAANLHRHLENIKSLQRELAEVARTQQLPQGPVRAVVRAQRPAASISRDLNGPIAFWNPYNRAPEPAALVDLSTTTKRESP
jgi:hypothetical protein